MCRCTYLYMYVFVYKMCVVMKLMFAFFSVFFEEAMAEGKIWGDPEDGLWYERSKKRTRVVKEKEAHCLTRGGVVEKDSDMMALGAWISERWRAMA